MLITDAQVHLWGPEDPQHPWPPGGRARAHRDVPLEAPEFLAEMDRAGVARSIIVPPNWTGWSNAFALAAAAQSPHRLAVMGNVNLNDPSSVDVPSWLNQPGMLGARLTFYHPREEVHVDDGKADWFFAAANEIDMPIMIYAPLRSTEIADVAASYPRLRFIVDHLNLAIDLNQDGIDREVDALLPLADRRNIAVKISSLPVHVDEGYPFPTLHPTIKRVIDAFGARRCMWGSDFSRIPCTYGEWVRTFTEAIDFIRDEDLELIMGGTLETWLNWPAAPGLD